MSLELSGIYYQNPFKLEIFTASIYLDELQNLQEYVYFSIAQSVLLASLVRVIPKSS